MCHSNVTTIRLVVCGPPVAFSPGGLACHRMAIEKNGGKLPPWNILVEKEWSYDLSYNSIDEQYNGGLEFAQQYFFRVRILNQHNIENGQMVLEVLQQFRLIYGSMRSHFRLVEERCGISGSQMWVLQEVQRTPEVGIGELARRLGIHQSTCSLLVDKLVSNGYVEKRKQQKDQRRVGLVLADRGYAALAALPGPAEGLLPQALSAIPPVVLKTLQINLQELLAHLPGKDENYANMPLADILRPTEED